jgi:hypothetical protein
MVHIPPAGVSPLGLTVLRKKGLMPEPPVIRADKLNYTKQAFLSVTKDSDPVDAAVIESLYRVRGSGAAVMNKGSRFKDITKLDDRATELIISEARKALARIIRRGDITIRTMTVETTGDTAVLTVNYINNRSKLRELRQAIRRLPEDI